MIKSWKAIGLGLICAVGLSLASQAQALKKVTAEDVFKLGTFTQKTISGINWMKDGQYYSSQIVRNGAPMVVKMNLATGE